MNITEIRIYVISFLVLNLLLVLAVILLRNAVVSNTRVLLKLKVEFAKLELKLRDLQSSMTDHKVAFRASASSIVQNLKTLITAIKGSDGQK